MEKGTFQLDLENLDRLDKAFEMEKQFKLYKDSEGCKSGVDNDFFGLREEIDNYVRLLHRTYGPMEPIMVKRIKEEILREYEDLWRERVRQFHILKREFVATIKYEYRVERDNCDKSDKEYKRNMLKHANIFIKAINEINKKLKECDSSDYLCLYLAKFYYDSYIENPFYTLKNKTIGTYTISPGRNIFQIQFL